MPLTQLIDRYGHRVGTDLWHAQNEQLDGAVELILMEYNQWRNAAMDAAEKILPFSARRGLI